MTADNATTVADALASIADLIRGGLPVPISVSISASLSGDVTVQVRSDDLGPWLTLAEVAWPTWEVFGEHAHAVWPDDTFADLPFSLAACRRVEAPALSVVAP